MGLLPTKPTRDLVIKTKIIDRYWSLRGRGHAKLGKAKFRRRWAGLKITTNLILIKKLLIFLILIFKNYRIGYRIRYRNSVCSLVAVKSAVL